ncbi:MAG: hypothetical protein QOK19_299 [Solirubrobacteraceae bacterium]|jgi:hypothetical protein|nr:hypothetical protein [Solirubrobacteraceae bacterium]
MGTLSEQIIVLEGGRELAFSFADMLRYNGHRSPGGVAHAFKVLEGALPVLGAAGPPERRAIAVETSFSGPGARDGFELVTRAVTDGRYRIEPSLMRPDNGSARERFVFRLRYRDSGVTLALRDGFVTEEFLELAARQNRSPGEERELDELKGEMAERVMSAPTAEVYDAMPTTREGATEAAALDRPEEGGP